MCLTALGQTRRCCLWDGVILSSSLSVWLLICFGTAALDVWGVQPDYMNMSNTFGSCTSGSVAAPILAATSFVTVRLPRSLPRIRLAIHSSTSISRPAARVGAQLSMAVSGESAMVRDGTGKPDAEAA